MLKIRFALMALGMLLCSAASPVVAQVSIGIGLPNVSIGINVPAYPELVVVPGYPVYYAPRLDANFFFYDGMYWVYQDENWYESTWYNGPWQPVNRDIVPMFLLRVPVGYYRHPPAFFMGWRFDAPPRWGEHWGRGWEQRRSGWNRWNRSKVHAPAPLPAYQRQYSGDRYPGRVEQQHEIQQEHYRYEPRDPLVREHYQQHGGPEASMPQGKPAHERQVSPERNTSQHQKGLQEPLQRTQPKSSGHQPQQGPSGHQEQRKGGADKRNGQGQGHGDRP